MANNFYPRQYQYSKHGSSSRSSVLPGTASNGVLSVPSKRSSSYIQWLKVSRVLRRLVQLARRYNVSPVWFIGAGMLLTAGLLYAVYFWCSALLRHSCGDETLLYCTGVFQHTVYQNQPPSEHLHILIVHDFLPQPDTLGSDKRLMHIIQQLQQLMCTVSVVGRTSAGMDVNAPTLAAMNVKYLAPLSSSSALIEFAHTQHIDVMLFTIWFWNDDLYTNLVSQITAVRQRLPQMTVMGLSDDCHAMREMQFACDPVITKYNSRSVQSYYGTYCDILPIEMEAYSMLDRMWTITERDQKCIQITMALYNKQTGMSLSLPPMSSLHYVYPTDPPVLNHQIDKLYDQRVDLLFVGYNDNIANLYSLYQFAENVMPLIVERIGSVTLHIVGSAPSHKFNYWRNSHGKLTPPANVKLHGYLPSDQLQDLLLSTRIFVSPLRYGTGVNTKNVLALMYGLPLVTTSIGAGGLVGACAQIIDSSDIIAKVNTADDTFIYEQCNALASAQASNAEQFVQSQADDPQYPCYLVVNSAPAMAVAIAELYSDEARWDIVHRNALQYAKTFYGKQRLAEELTGELPRLYTLSHEKYQQYVAKQ